MFGSIRVSILKKKNCIDLVRNFVGKKYNF